MVSKLRLAKGIVKTSSTLKKFLKKFSNVASQLKKGIKEVWDLLFSSKEIFKTSTKDEGLFSTLPCTFQDENIWVIDSGASRHMTGQHKQFKTLSKWKSSYSKLKEDNGVCKGCALGKSTKRPFGSSDSRSKEILDLIHSDVCGPMTSKSLRSHLYYVTFIDDHSRKTWVYLMKSKDEVFTKFQEFKVEVENLTKKRIKILRSDNGGEYTSKELIVFYKESGIKRELTVPYNPEQNGVAERKN